MAVLGIPIDYNASYLRGPAAAPDRIREVLNGEASNLCAENGIDLGSDLRFVDLGNLQPDGAENAFEAIFQTVKEWLDRGVRLVTLGGDHSVTYPIVRAYHAVYGPLTVVQFDAHPDLYDVYDGNRHSHACPFARIMEQGLAARLVQIGIRTATPHQRAQAKRFGVESLEMRDWPPQNPLVMEGPLYLSLDMDALDPAFAPGVSHHEPGGLSVRDVLGIVHRLPGPILGADIVEFNPVRDPAGITAAAAAKFLKEIAAAMIEFR